MPWLFERRFGIRAFDYWWGYTTAQIELMVMDQPVVDYGHDKGKKGKKSMIATKKEEDELNDLVAAWQRDRQGKSYVGKTFSLGDFLEGKVW